MWLVGRRFAAINIAVAVTFSGFLMLSGTPAAAVGEVPPTGRLCFGVAGSPGDAAIVNLTPVEAQGAGFGLLISSDVITPPVGSNVNYGIGTVDPNVAVATIGADGKVCYANSKHTNVQLVADHLGTIPATGYTPATTSGAPDRKVDTRIGKGGAIVPPNRVGCVSGWLGRRVMRRS